MAVCVFVCVAENGVWINAGKISSTEVVDVVAAPGTRRLRFAACLAASAGSIEQLAVHDGVD